MQKTIVINNIFAVFFFLAGLSGVMSPVYGIDKSGILCSEMGAEVAYYFIRGKVIRYSAFHAFIPPTELQKQLYGNYLVQGGLIKWKDNKTMVRFSYNMESKILAANEKWNVASPCETITFPEIKDHFRPILQGNRSVR